MPSTTVVLDTNIFVSAGFNPHSRSAKIIEAVRDGHIELVWTESIRAETRHILEKIPPLNWHGFADLFKDESQYAGATHSGDYTYVQDEADRKFLALAEATGAALISHDEDLLAHAKDADIPIMTPENFLSSTPI